ncbi:AMP-binding protein, partial [Chitinophaga qingshengii]
VLDRRHHIVPSGVTGELCIGGAGVSNGYWGKPALTAEKFIDNPFGAGKLYCSGDLVRWTTAGELEFLGRRDEQVKINGYRVELGEIASVLSVCPGVKQAALAIKPGIAGQPALVAYVTSDGTADRKQIYQQLS